MPKRRMGQTSRSIMVAAPVPSAFCPIFESCTAGINKMSLVLNMIVKNEELIIERCLESVIPFIDAWVIHDTGSTDNTCKIIKEVTQRHGVERELRQVPWTNFGANRTQALQDARGKGTHILLMDADFILHTSGPWKATLDPAKSYHVLYSGNTYYRNLKILRGDAPWLYHGVTHEYVSSPVQHSFKNIDNVVIEHVGDGGCKQDKFERDIQLLNEGLQQEPHNTRYQFYLANSYFDVGNYIKAADWYRKRIEGGQFAEEVYFSMFKLGKSLQLQANKMTPDALSTYFQAFQYRQTRLEALYEIVAHYRTENPRIGFCFAYMAYPACLRFPSEDILFVDRNIHTHRFLDELATCAYYAKMFTLAIACTDILLERAKAGDIELDVVRLRKNRCFSEAAIASEEIL